MDKPVIRMWIMTEPVSICVRLGRSDYLDFKRLSKQEGLDSLALADKLVHEYLRKHKRFLSAERGGERRRFPRKLLSVPAVSLVNFIDNETRSYPVVVKDISQSGVRIMFRQAGPIMNERIDKATDFEVVFTLPKTSLTVSLFCKLKRVAVDKYASMIGVFEKESKPTISMMSDFFERGAQGNG